MTNWNPGEAECSLPSISLNTEVRWVSVLPGLSDGDKYSCGVINQSFKKQYPWVHSSLLPFIDTQPRVCPREGWENTSSVSSGPNSFLPSCFCLLLSRVWNILPRPFCAAKPYPSFQGTSQIPSHPLNLPDPTSHPTPPTSLLQGPLFWWHPALGGFLKPFSVLTFVLQARYW